ncbi:hypothetical protein Zmor_027475 [Zophobas morio]|uniref:Uncharacterized protein n=1 Tax=Zophobas morio TaxID=2755281 RepID=A0AA38M200_9CUCU|nr:hypothetical protein Zmor_027475 [Zophobas morio]
MKRARDGAGNNYKIMAFNLDAPDPDGSTRTNDRCEGKRQNGLSLEAEDLLNGKGSENKKLARNINFLIETWTLSLFGVVPCNSKYLTSIRRVKEIPTTS